jgi:hypothetical protein
MRKIYSSCHFFLCVQSSNFSQAYFCSEFFVVGKSVPTEKQAAVIAAPKQENTQQHYAPMRSVSR